MFYLCGVGIKDRNCKLWLILRLRRKAIERAISIAEYCGKYDCFLPTGEDGVSDSWRLEYDGKEYRLSKNKELLFRCHDRANIERYLSENVFV